VPQEYKPVVANVPDKVNSSLLGHRMTSSARSACYRRTGVAMHPYAVEATVPVCWMR